MGDRVSRLERFAILFQTLRDERGTVQLTYWPSNKDRPPMFSALVKGSDANIVIRSERGARGEAPTLDEALQLLEEHVCERVKHAAIESEETARKLRAALTGEPHV